MAATQVTAGESGSRQAADTTDRETAKGADGGGGYGGGVWHRCQPQSRW